MAPVPTLAVVTESPTEWVVSVTFSEPLGWPALGWGGFRFEGCSMTAFDCNSPHLECGLTYEATIVFEQLEASLWVEADVTSDQAGNRNAMSNVLQRAFDGHRALSMAVDGIQVEWGGTLCLSPAEITEYVAFCESTDANEGGIVYEECLQYTVDVSYVEANDGVESVQGVGGAAFRNALLVDGTLVQVHPRRPFLAPGDQASQWALHHARLSPHSFPRSLTHTACPCAAVVFPLAGKKYRPVSWRP